MTGNLVSLARIVAEARAELAQVEWITDAAIHQTEQQIAEVERRVAAAKEAGEREIAELYEQIAESKQRLAVSRAKLTQAELRFDAARQDEGIL
jgi:hypothetical protein